MSGAKKKLAQKEAMAQLGLTEKEKRALEEAAAKKGEIRGRLDILRSGLFGEKRRSAKQSQLQNMADYQQKKGGSL